MKQIIIIIAFCNIIVSNSCTPVAKILFGMKKPRVETDNSLKTFLKEIGITLDTLLVCKDSSNLFDILKDVNRVPEIEVFDCNGYFIPYKTSSDECNAGVEVFLEKMFSVKTYSVEQKNIQSRLTLLVDSKTHQSFKFDSLPKSEYYVLIYFAKYGGKKLNREHVTAWLSKINSLSAENSLKVTVLLTSYDFMNFW